MRGHRPPPRRPGRQTPLLPLPHPGAAALTGSASRRPAASGRGPDPRFCAPFPRVPRTPGSEVSSPRFSSPQAFLAGAGDRARCYLPPPPPARALRATPPTPRDFQGPRRPNPAKCRAPLIGPGSAGTSNQKGSVSPFFPLPSDSVSRPGVRRREEERHFLIQNPEFVQTETVLKNLGSRFEK